MSKAFSCYKMSKPIYKLASSVKRQRMGTNFKLVAIIANH